MSSRSGNAMLKFHPWARRALFAVLMFALGGTGDARELYRENFEELPVAARAGATAGIEGQGWRQHAGHPMWVGPNDRMA